MPAVDPEKLKRLMVTELLVPFAMERRLSGGQLADIVARATRDKRFDLSASSDDFAGYMDEAEATDWAVEFERAGTAPHLFTGEAQEPEAMVDGLKQSDFLKLPPEQRLAIANKIADGKRNAKK